MVEERGWVGVIISTYSTIPRKSGGDVRIYRRDLLVSGPLYPPPPWMTTDEVLV